jgi:steroid delta-isomerase-like uncharacterized protein
MSQLDPKAKAGSFRAPPPLPSSMEVHASKGGDDEQKLLDATKTYFTALSASEAQALGLLTDDFTLEDLMEARAIHGKKDAKGRIDSLRRAFPDFQLTPTTQIAADGMVADEATFVGTLKISLGPMKPTGKSVELHSANVFEIKDGKLTRRTSYANSKEGFDLLSSAPAPAPKSATGHGNRPQPITNSP